MLRALTPHHLMVDIDIMALAGSSHPVCQIGSMSLGTGLSEEKYSSTNYYLVSLHVFVYVFVLPQQRKIRPQSVGSVQHPFVPAGPFDFFSFLLGVCVVVLARLPQFMQAFARYLRAFVGQIAEEQKSCY